MHLWLFFLAGTAAYGTSRISEPGLEAVNFAAAIHGRKLTENVIKEMELNSENDCSFACLEEEKCRSYNFGRKKAKNICQLSDSDRFVGAANFTEDKNFTYVGVQSSCEIDVTCSSYGNKGVCIPDYQQDSALCKCADGYEGKPCEAKSCAQLLQDGSHSSGVYTINPDGGKPISVLCDMTTEGGGWTVFQRRLNGSLDFYLDWVAYKNGFGNLKGEFWLGNNNLHRLTEAENVTLRVDLEDFDGNITYAEYTIFKVAGEGDKYRLLIGGYSGTAGDSMAYQSGSQFSTKDNDNDLDPGGSCALRHKGIWWYTRCHRSNLNGLYLKGPFQSNADGVVWRTFRGTSYSLKRTEMKLKPKFK